MQEVIPFNSQAFNKHKYEVDQRVWHAREKCIVVIRAASFRVSDLLTQRDPGYRVRLRNGRIGTAMELELSPVLASPEELLAREPVAIVTASRAGQLSAWATKHNAMTTIVLTAIGVLIAAATLLTSK